MKKYLVYLGACLMLCTLSKTTFAKEVITGSGNIVKEDRDVSKFTEVATSDNIEIELIQGKLDIEVLADDNIQKYVQTYIQNNRLTVSVSDQVGIKPSKSVKVLVSLPEITYIEASSKGEVESNDHFKCSDVKIIASSSGEIDLNLNARYLSVYASSSADVDLHVDAEDLKLECVSNAEVDLDGEAERFNVKVNSKGKVDAEHLISGSCDAKTASAGTLEVHATDHFSGDASSASKIELKGNPKDCNTKTSSLGKIVKDNDFDD